MSRDGLFMQKSFDFRGQNLEIFFPSKMDIEFGGFLEQFKTIDAYEPIVTAFLDSHVDQNVTFIDVGAQLGLFSVFAHLKGATVFSFEMRKLVFMSLFMTKQVNNLVRLHLINAAASDVGALIPYQEDHQMLLTGGNEKPTACDYDYVLSVTGDQVLNSIALTERVVIKIDVEGFEHRVLKGLHSLIVRLKPILVIEVHKHPMWLYGSTLDQFENDIKGMGYTIKQANSHRQNEMGMQPFRITNSIPDNIMIFCFPDL